MLCISSRCILGLSGASFQNGFNPFIQFIFLCVVNIIFTFSAWDRFKHTGDSQFLEIITTWKEIMSFHYHGVVVFRFGLILNESFSNIILPYLLIKGGL